MLLFKLINKYYFKTSVLIFDMLNFDRRNPYKQKDVRVLNNF